MTATAVQRCDAAGLHGRRSARGHERARRGRTHLAHWRCRVDRGAGGRANRRLRAADTDAGADGRARALRADGGRAVRSAGEPRELRDEGRRRTSASRSTRGSRRCAMRAGSIRRSRWPWRRGRSPGRASCRRGRSCRSRAGTATSGTVGRTSRLRRFRDCSRRRSWSTAPMRCVGRRGRRSGAGRRR